MNKLYSAKKYFIYNIKRIIKNNNKILSKKYRPNFIEIITDYIEIYEDYKNNSYNEKLKKSLTEYLNVISFNIKYFPLKNHTILKSDFDLLISFINAETADYKKIYISLHSLKKKMEYLNLIELIISEVKSKENFSSIDELSFLFINEILSMGYSLQFLDKWINEVKLVNSITTDNIDSKLSLFERLYFKKNEFTYYLNIHNNNSLLEGEQCIFNDKEDNKINILKVSFEDVPKNSFLQNSKNYDVFKVKIKVMDIFKGIEIIKNAINEYFQLISFINKLDSDMVLEKMIVVDEKGYIQNLSFEEYDKRILFSGTEIKEKQDINDFIDYRNKALKANKYQNDLLIIQRALNIVRTQMEQTKENRLINLWSVIEYILTFNEGKSIIGKVKDTIPKLICCYFIKDKINSFWQEVLTINPKKYEIINEIRENCKKSDTSLEYDLNNFLTYLNTKDGALISELDNFSTLQRDIAFIGEFITNKETRKKQIDFLYQEIENDIIRIYRTRNVIVHSGYETNTNIDLKNVRLYKYCNHLLGVLVYFKNKNPNFTIQEILNSIHFTYENYISTIQKEDNPDLFFLCKPRFSFL